MLNRSNKVKKVILAILSVVAILGIATTATKIANNQKAKVMPASTHVTGQYDLVQPGDENLPETPNVQFDAYFLNDSVKTRGALLGPINKDQNPIPTKELYIELKVLGEGKVKNGEIKFESKNNIVSGNFVSDDVIDSYGFKESKRVLKLKEFKNGRTKIIRVEITPQVNSKEDFFRDDNKIILAGTYVDNNGNEIEISKTVNYVVETMYDNLTSSSSIVKEENVEYSYYENENPSTVVKIINKASQFTKRFGYSELKDTHKSDSYKVREVPKFNGYQAEKIEAYYTNSKNDKVEDIKNLIYDKVNNTLNIYDIGYNEPGYILNIRFTYPIESGKNHTSQEIEVRGIYEVEAYNNTNFNALVATPKETIEKKYIKYKERDPYEYNPQIVDIYSGSIMSDNLEKVYNSDTDFEKYDIYKVVWVPYVKEYKEGDIVLSEDKSQYGDIVTEGNEIREDNKIVELNDFISYREMVYACPDDLLRDDSVIEIYDDETNELIKSFNKTEIIENKNIKNKFPKKIRHIKIKLKNIPINDKKKLMTFYFTKEIDNEILSKKMDKTTFEKNRNKYIHSSLQIDINNKISKFTGASSCTNPKKKTLKYDISTVVNGRSKFVEQVEYNGIDTSNVKNEFTYLINGQVYELFEDGHEINIYDNFKKYLKAIKFESTSGFYLRNNDNFNNKTTDVDVDYIKYKGIYFKSILDDEDFVKIYNADSNELIHTFTKENIDNYNSIDKAFIYPEKIKKIIIETNKPTAEIGSIISIDTKELVKLEEKEDYLKNKTYIIQNIKTSIQKIKDSEYTDVKNGRIIVGLKEAHSLTSGKMTKPLSTYKVNKNSKQQINVSYSSTYPLLPPPSSSNFIRKEVILIKYPKEIKNIKINSIINNEKDYQYNDLSGKILGYEQYEKDGYQYIKVYTTSDKIERATNIFIDADIQVDPTIESKRLYATIYNYNNLINKYYTSTKDVEDINLNKDKEEEVGISRMEIDIITPDSLVISQELSDYNNKNDHVYGPNTGFIENNGTGKATVNIYLTNRWSPAASNIKILGRIPYEGNKTPISKESLKSTFNTTLRGPIEIPDELEEKVRIYYSEVESNNTIDINDNTYNWIEYTNENKNQINWSKVKSFFVDLGNNKINAGKTVKFKYDVNIPQSTTTNEKSYATAAALFDLETKQDGNIKSSAESDRVGVIFLKRYNLNISALIKGNKNPIAKSIYKIENYEEDDDKIVKIGETDSQGRAVVKDLRVNERYKLTEETTDSDYVVNKQPVDFILKELDNGNLELEIQKDGNIVETSVIQPTETENATVNINMEYLQKYSLKINKMDKESRTPVKGATYILKPTTDNGESNISGSTNENGEVIFKGLIPKVNYTLEEKSSPQYYLNPKVKYEVSEVNGAYSLNITEGEVESKELVHNNTGLNNAKITLLGEKIKTYSININKYEKGKNKKLSKAQFKVVGDGYENGKTIETNDEGIAKLEGLYEYREDKDYTAEYTVTEIIAPDGYKKSEGTLKFKVQRNSNNEMELKVLEDTLTKKNKSDTNGNKGIRIENSIVNIDIENELFFKLIKKDGKTEEGLPNTKFAIYKVNEDGTDSIALDIKGNKVGILERDTNIPNGEGYVVTTNESGEISIALPEGKYKFIEIQAPDYKYDLPSAESERTYYFTVKNNRNSTYKLLENKNIKKVLKESYGPGEGEIDSTYVNGKTVHYKLDKEGEKYHLRFYNNEFDIIKDLELNRQIDDLAIYAIGNNGIIYTVSGQKIVKFSDDGSYIGEYPISRTGMNFRSYGILRKSTMFGNRIFANNKVLIRQWGNGAIYDIDTGTELNRLLGNIKIRFDWWIDKPSYNGGIIELDFSRASNEKSESINIYDDNLKLIKNFPVKAYKFEPNFYPNSRNNLEELHEDIEGNIYVNTYINESEDRSEISVYDREGNLQKTIQKPLVYFKVLPDGKIYFYGFDGTRNKVILTDNNGNKLAEKELEGNNVKLDTLKINADGSIEYSDNNQNLITHKLDLIEEESTEEQQSELVVTNNWKKYKITTSAGEHGTISGAGETPYEEVEIYSNATKEITITPEEGYRIKKVTINGATVPITLNSDNKTMTITKFENMTENKDIKAEFSNQGVTIRTNHYIKDTTTPVSQSEVQTVDMGENYTTAPKTLAKYELEKNERGEYVIPTNASGTVPVVTNPADKRDIEVTYYYTKKKAKVITKYLLDKGDGNTEEIKTPNEQTLEIDTQYTTSSDVGNPKYELIRVEGSSTGTIENTDDITVTYIYRVKRAKVIVKYLDVTESETGTPLPSNDGGTVEDVEINGQVDDRYRTTEANNVQPNYSLVSTPENDSGTMTIAPTTVVYKYRKVAPTINNINVTKVGPNKIASKTQLNTYNITFNVNLSNYIGSGSVKLTDKLPYGIHHEASDELASGLALDGGIYNDATKEIVWNIPISDISSYKQSVERNENNTTITQDGTSVNVTINKTISIRYKDLPNYNQGEEPKIENGIFGKIILDRNNEREVNSKSNSPANYNTAITVKKKWNDNSNSAEKRPTSITFALYKTINGQETKVKDYTLTGSTTTDDGWETKIEQLPLYDGRAQTRNTEITNAGELGNPITYRIEETSSNKFYQRATTKPTENEYILTNTFTVPADKIEVQVNKVWEDNSNANGKRPASIKYVLSGNGLTKEQTVTGNTSTNEDWSYKFTDLPKYNAQGNEIVYTVAEQEATTDGLKFYSNEISGEYTTGITIKNKFTVPENKIEVPVTKTWLDDNNSRSKRPASIKYVLKGGATEIEQVVTGNSTTDENWNYTFTNLPKYNNQGNVINYSIEEQEVTTNDLKFYTKAVNGFNVTNTFKVPEDKVTPRVTLTWEDGSNVNGKRPNNVKLVVKDKEGKIVKEATITGNPTDEEWNKVFENVPKYDKDGNPIPYTVEEKPNSPDDFKFYKITITGDIDKGYKVTNKFEVPDEKITVKVKKVWEDNNNRASKRPTAIKVQLKNNAAIVREERVTGSGNEWTYTFENVAKYNGYGDVINYTVEEIEEQTEDLKFYEKKITGDKDSEYVITNKFKVPDEKIEINVNKTWEDNNNAANKRPTSIKYVLSGNNQTQEQVVSGNRTTDVNWNYTFTNLAKYNAQGNEITYTVEEQEVNANDLKFYTKKISGEQTNGFAVINKFTVPKDKITVKVSKTWDDESNKANKRPSSIKYEVLNRNNQIVASKVQIGNKNTADGWSHNFELDKYDALGNEEVYNVQEVEVNQNDFKFYRATVSGNYKKRIHGNK